MNTREAFEKFDRENPSVWGMFSVFTFQVINSGVSRFGVAAIWERLRWWSTVETKGRPYKLNNTFRAWYARKFEEKFPKHAGFFEKRKAKADEEPEETSFERLSRFQGRDLIFR